ncbi:MAG: hypothetical protein AWM53_01553 [Candidatus Dichloromethanomonas elyunquensis]|nr:MAG: hypothetical protein AWM53_01553 [Candidatus Dichloromethanomonas elyunquensis]
MSRLKEMILQLIKGISDAILRFPLSVINLFCSAILICYMISLHREPPLIIQKLVFAFVVGAILGMTAQFAAERFAKLAQKRLMIYGLSALLTTGYLLILWPAPEISPEIGIRTFVAVFALICAVLWFPAFKEKTDFNIVALIHFKSVFTSVLYSGVLSAGIAAIIATVNILLFHVTNDAYPYMMTIIWVLFAPIYYLSLLPRFNVKDNEGLEAIHSAGSYPRFLQILVSYIAIPLVAVYTLVLFAYFIKILVTLHWPSGQLGPMVLIYSAAGLLIFVLSSLLENRFAILYRMIFPKVLIPIVIMQMISVGIRLRAYGVTESRYYVALFGIFSIATGLLLSIKPVSKNHYIALFAAGFAVFSVIPPMDAFTVSRNSQIGRVEKILQSEGIFSNGKLTPKAGVPEQSKIEITSILSYLEGRSSLKYIKWLPEDFHMYRDMKKTIGFEPVYGATDGELVNRYFSANADMQKPLIISDYDISVQVFSNRYQNGPETGPVRFTLKGTDYILTVKRLTDQEVRISITNSAGTELIGTGLYDFVKTLPDNGILPKESIPSDKMTLDIAQSGYKLRVILQNVNITLGTGSEAGADYSAMVLFGVPGS